MIFRIILIVVLIISSINLFGQDPTIKEKKDADKKYSIEFQGDSRRTFVNRESAGIFGVRLGVLFREKTEVGLGIYSSNLFGLLGSSVRKDYQDNSIMPPPVFASEIGFHYFSVYGEYRLIDNERIMLTINSQIGLGRVDIDFVEPNLGKDRIREGKSLVEHSIKADVKTLEWLRLIGGVGYRYLIAGESQIKKAFNAPIYIIGFSIDFKLLYGKIFKKK